MGLCDLILGEKFDVKVDKVELGQHHEVEPYTDYRGILLRRSYVEDFGVLPVPMPGYTYFDIEVEAELIPKKRSSIRIPVKGLYKSDYFEPKSRLEQEISGINQLIHKEGVVLHTRIRIEIPPVDVTADSQYAKDASKMLPKDLYQRIVEYAQEKGAITPSAMPHG